MSYYFTVRKHQYTKRTDSLPLLHRLHFEFPSSHLSQQRPTTEAPYISSSRRTRTRRNPARATELCLREDRRPAIETAKSAHESTVEG